MAWYKYAQFLEVKTNTQFDTLHEPGSKGEWSGIYRCHGCGKEIVHTIGHPLPPQNHHQHTAAQGRIQWRLIVTDGAS